MLYNLVSLLPSPGPSLPRLHHTFLADEKYNVISITCRFNIIYLPTYAKKFNNPPFQ